MTTLASLSRCGQMEQTKFQRSLGLKFDLRLTQTALEGWSLLAASRPSSR